MAAFAERILHTGSRGCVDVNAAFGGAELPLSLLLAEHEAHGIDLAFARHLEASRFDPLTGNQLTADAAAEFPNRIAAIAVVAPTRTDSVARQITQAETLGVVGYWIEDRIPLGIRSAATEELVGQIAQTRKPLFSPLRQWGDAFAVGELTERFAAPVILCGAHYDHWADDIAACERFPHLLLETSALAHLGALQDAVKRIGAERILFGTGAIERPAACALAAILYADLAEREKSLILAGNAERLFGLDRREVDLSAPELDGGFVDVHCHIPPVPFGVPPITPDEMIGYLRPRGIETAAASSIEAFMFDLDAGNAAMATACAEIGGLLGYVVVDPTDLDNSRAQLVRHFDQERIVGCKIHCQYSKCPTASREMKTLFDLLGDFGRPVKIHNDGDGWADALLEYATDHPQLPIIIAHAGLGTPTPDAGQIAASADNVYVEFSSSFPTLINVRKTAKLAGAEKVLFGTDCPLLEPAFVLGTYLDAGITAAEWPRVGRANAARLFQLPRSTADA